MTQRHPVRVPSTSFRPFDLLLVAGVAVMAAGLLVGSPRLRTAAEMARRAMQRETVAALTVGIVAVAIVAAGIVLLTAAWIGRRRQDARAHPPR